MQFRNMSLQAMALMLGLMVSMQGVWAQQVQPSELPSYFTLRDGTSNKESIPLHEAMWGLFVMTNDMESKVTGSATDHFENSVGLTGKTAGELVRYIRQAVDASRTFSVNQGKQLCAARNELTSSSVLAAKFENMEQETLLNRQTHLFNVSQVLVSCIVNTCSYNVRVFSWPGGRYVPWTPAPSIDARR